MSVDDAAYWDNPILFGREFAISFPKSAIVELSEAGNCFAVGRWTACLFHCMRIAEYGLRKLARTVGAKISDKGNRCPLEYGDWNKVITEIRGKITVARTLSLGAKRERRLQFYSESADHCEYMKDIWRNEISHARRIYNKEETLGAFNRVRDFIQLLARNCGSAGISRLQKIKLLSEQTGIKNEIRND